MTIRLHGLVAATHTPFDGSGALNLDVVERLADHLLRHGVQTAFIGGTTGESHSLSVDERLQLAQRWVDVTRGSGLRVVVHVGANSLADASTLARQAQSLGATAIAALAPSYFKPRSLDVLVACCAEITRAAPEIPFYFYDIPVMTGVQLSMPEFLARAADQLPTLCGIKFSNPDLMAYQQCLQAHDGRFDIPWGIDECWLAALAVGSQGAVGSTYNFAAPVFLRLLAAFERGDLQAARVEQRRSVQLVQVLARYGYMGAAKAVMGFLGVDVGPARLPNTSLSNEQCHQLRESLDQLEFFQWIESNSRGR